MSYSAYASVAGEGGSAARGNERRAFDEVIAALSAAERAGRRSREAIDALFGVTRLWNLLVDDLGSPENGLPAALRAQLISIGIWVLKEAERIRREESANFAGLRDVCVTVRAGLA